MDKITFGLEISLENFNIWNSKIHICIGWTSNTSAATSCTARIVVHHECFIQKITDIIGHYSIDIFNKTGDSKQVLIPVVRNIIRNPPDIHFIQIKMEVIPTFNLSQHGVSLYEQIFDPIYILGYKHNIINTGSKIISSDSFYLNVADLVNYSFYYVTKIIELGISIF